MTLTLAICPWVKVMIQLCEILSRSNLAMRSYGPDTDFGYVCTVTLTPEIWPWVKVTHPSVIDNNSLIVWNIIQIQLGSEELWPGHWFWVFVHCDLDLEDMTLGQGHDTPLGYGQQLSEILSRSNLTVRSYNPGQGFPVYVHCDLDLGDMTLSQGHDTPLGHGQQLSEILSRSNLAVRSYGPDTDFEYVCTVTFTLEIWPWVKVMTHPWVMDNNCVKLYPDRTREYEAMARTRCEQTDRQTDGQTNRVIPI